METETHKSGAPHGTASRYTRGCHCRKCRTAWADYCRERAHRLGRQPRDRAYFAGRGDPIPVRPTPLGRRILAEAEDRTGVDRHDIVEYLLREVGPRVTGDAATGLRTCSD